MTVLLITLGAAVGAPLRYLTDRAVQVRWAPVFPWGTLLVNVVGSGLLGLLAARPVDGPLMALAGTGFCGALTTYSTFGHETVRLAEAGEWGVAARYVAGSVAAGLGAAYAGMLVAHL